MIAGPKADSVQWFARPVWLSQAWLSTRNWIKKYIVAKKHKSCTFSACVYSAVWQQRWCITYGIKS